MAQFNLGLAYVNGRGVPKDYRQAAAWYRKAADQEYADAQDSLGFMYANGEGVPQDDRQAAAWYRKAADQGHAGAQLSLGFSYWTGRGVPRDDVLAYMWFNLAVSRSSGVEQKLSVANRDRVSARLTPQQRADGQRMAREWQAAFEKRKQ